MHISEHYDLVNPFYSYSLRYNTIDSHADVQPPVVPWPWVICILRVEARLT
jgi:hypothetical protein